MFFNFIETGRSIVVPLQKNKRLGSYELKFYAIVAFDLKNACQYVVFIAKFLQINCLNFASDIINKQEITLFFQLFKMTKSILQILLFSILGQLLNAQTNGYGIKLGPSLGFQNWGGGNKRDPLLRLHIAAFMDSESSDSKNVIYGQLGYHIKGGGIRFPYFYDLNGNRVPGGTYAMEFHNLSLDIGLKRFFTTGAWKSYYAIGLRGEYTLSTKFEIYEELKEWTNYWNYGFSLKVGTEFKIQKLVNGGIELNIAPDLSKQIYVPASIRRYNPFTRVLEPGYETSAINTTVEISFYLRFIQLIEYD